MWRKIFMIFYVQIPENIGTHMSSVVSLCVWTQTRQTMSSLSKPLSFPQCRMDLGISRVIWMSRMVVLTVSLHRALAHGGHWLSESTTTNGRLPVFENENKIPPFAILTDIIHEEEIGLNKNFSFPSRVVINREKWTIPKHLQNETDPFLS